MVIGFGQGLVMIPVFGVVLAGVPTDRAGVASGVLTTTQQATIAVGVAALGTLFFRVASPGVAAARRGRHADWPGATLAVFAVEAVLALLTGIIATRLLRVRRVTDMIHTCRTGGGVPGRRPVGRGWGVAQTRNSSAGADQHTPPAKLAAGIAITFVIGVLLACQSRVNGQLGSELHDGIVAATWSFGSGLVVLAIIAALVPGMRSGLRSVVAALRAGRPAGSTERDGSAAGTGSPWALRPWQVLGGVCGAYLVVTQSATVGLVGVAVFTVAVVAGQAGSSLVVDRLGLGPGGRQPVTTRRMVGAVLALGAVLLTVAHQLGTPSTAALAILPALAGVGTAWQQAVNGRVARAAAGPPADTEVPRAASGSRPAGTNGNGLVAALVAALTNFGVGTAALVIAAAVDVGVRGMPTSWPGNPLLYIGGLFGIAFISLAAYVVKITGVLLLGLTSVAGQLVGALVLDAALPTSSAHLTVTTIIGTLLTLVAVGIAAVPARRRPAAASG